MADSTKVLGHAAPAAATLTTLYTVPASTKTVVKSLTACNRDASVASKIRVAVSKAGAAIANSHYFVYD